MPGNWKTTRECPTVSRCCCCVSLKIGGVILGAVNIILFFLCIYGDVKCLIYDPPEYNPEPTWDQKAWAVFYIAFNCMYIFSELNS